MAFIDHYTAWVTGPSAEANQAGIQAIIDRAFGLGKKKWGHIRGGKDGYSALYTERQ